MRLPVGILVALCGSLLGSAACAGAKPPTCVDESVCESVVDHYALNVVVAGGERESVVLDLHGTEFHLVSIEFNGRSGGDGMMYDKLCVLVDPMQNAFDEVGFLLQPDSIGPPELRAMCPPPAEPAAGLTSRPTECSLSAWSTGLVDEVKATTWYTQESPNSLRFCRYFLDRP